MLEFPRDPFRQEPALGGGGGPTGPRGGGEEPGDCIPAAYRLVAGRTRAIGPPDRTRASPGGRGYCLPEADVPALVASVPQLASSRSASADAEPGSA